VLELCTPLGLATALVLFSCRAAPSVVRPVPATDAGPFALLLPDDAPPFVATTAVRMGDGFVRRTYGAGDKLLELTVARMSGEAGAYERWVAGSRDYLQVALPVGADQANGFFTCADADRGRACDLHIQFRSGFHVEGMGNGRVPKEDLVRLLGRLNLAVLADAPVLPM